MPPEPPRHPGLRASEYDPRPSYSGAAAAWRARTGSDEGKAVYKQRASTSGTVNADLKAHRGPGRFAVRGIGKATCAVRWSAPAYNLRRFGAALLA